MVKAILVGLEVDQNKEKDNFIHRREAACFAKALVIGFYGGIRGEEVLLTSLEWMMTF